MSWVWFCWHKLSYIYFSLSNAKIVPHNIMRKDFTTWGSYHGDNHFLCLEYCEVNKRILLLMLQSNIPGIYTFTYFIGCHSGLLADGTLYCSKSWVRFTFFCWTTLCILATSLCISIPVITTQWRYWNDCRRCGMIFFTQCWSWSEHGLSAVVLGYCNDLTHWQSSQQ